MQYYIIFTVKLDLNFRYMYECLKKVLGVLLDDVIGVNLS